MPAQTEDRTIDVRLYIGMIFFRWQIIVLCFLYALLGGVIYIQVVPRKYQAGCRLLVYQDPKLEIGKDVGSPWRTVGSVRPSLRRCGGGALGQQIDDLTLALVPPLSTYDNDVSGHDGFPVPMARGVWISP